jgi:hypothetical protein
MAMARREGGVEELADIGQGIRRLLAGWTRAERVIAAATVVMAVALFLDWTTISCTGSPVCQVVTTGGFPFHGSAWLTFLAFLGVVGLLTLRRLLREVVVRQPRLAVPDPLLYALLGGLELLGCFLYWLANPLVAEGPTTIAPGPGWYLAVIASGMTMAGAQLLRRAWPQQLELFDVMPPSPGAGTVPPTGHRIGRATRRDGRPAGGHRAGG